MLELILDRELTVGEIAAHFEAEVTRPAISQHLKVLRDAGLVVERREGTRHLYRARPEGLAELRAYVEWMWDDRLGHLKTAAETEARNRMNAGASGTIVRELRIEASPEIVFSYLIDPARLVTWMGTVATLDPRPGGVFRLDYSGQWVTSGTFVEVDPPRRIVFTWGWEMEGDPTLPGKSVVEFALTPDGDATVLRLTHSGLPAEAVGPHTEGWDHFLPRLTTAVTGGDQQAADSSTATDSN